MKDGAQVEWLTTLKSYLEKKPMVVLRFADEEWQLLQESRRGVNQFTITRAHQLFDDIKVPTAAIIIGRDDVHGEQIFFGIANSLSTVATLDTRLGIRRALKISPSSQTDLLNLVTDVRHNTNIKSRFDTQDTVFALSPKLSSHLLDQLAAVKSNHGPLHAVSAALNVPKRFKGAEALQQDAIQTALKAFGLSSEEQAVSLETVEGKETGLARVNIFEDSVIEHDARTVPGYSLVGSDLTGRAVFKKADERLEVFTANRRDLEHVLGVDLIYINVSKQNVVMLQYKMLEPAGRAGAGNDWVYRPDANLGLEIERMKRFSKAHAPGEYEYRLNRQVFYFKFVKRDGAISNGGIIMPLDHYERVCTDPAHKGARGAFRISYESLAGRYMRQGSFVNLVSSGYIGAHAETERQLRAVIEATLKDGKAVIAAIQSSEEDLQEVAA